MFESATVMALVTQYFTHTGLPSQRSHSIAIFFFGCTKMAPKGQATAQLRQPVQAFSSTDTKPLVLILRAPKSQAPIQTGFLHCLQTMGRQRPFSTCLETRILALAREYAPSFSKEQAKTHLEHPTQDSASTLILRPSVNQFVALLASVLKRPLMVFLFPRTQKVGCGSFSGFLCLSVFRDKL